MFRVLGPVRIGPSYSEYAPKSAKIRSLLATLVVSANRVVPKHALIEELWGERPPRTASTALHVYVSNLRKELPEAVRMAVLTEPSGYLLRASWEEFDLHCFQRKLDQGVAEMAALRYDAAILSLRGALDLWRGPALADVAAGPLLTAAASRADELRTAAQVRYIDAMMLMERHHEVVGELRALIAEHPLLEHFYEQFMLALYRSGRQAEALECYRDLRFRLSSDLGIDPSRRLQRLHRAILQADLELESPAWSLTAARE